MTPDQFAAIVAGVGLLALGIGIGIGWAWRGTAEEEARLREAGPWTPAPAQLRVIQGGQHRQQLFDQAAWDPDGGAA